MLLLQYTSKGKRYECFEIAAATKSFLSITFFSLVLPYYLVHFVMIETPPFVLAEANSVSKNPPFVIGNILLLCNANLPGTLWLIFFSLSLIQAAW